MLYARGSYFLNRLARCPVIQPRLSHVLMAKKEGSSSTQRQASTTGKNKAAPSQTTAEQGAQTPMGPGANAQHSEQFPLDPDVPVQQSRQFPLDPEQQPPATKGRRKKMTSVSEHLDNGTANGTGKGSGPQLSFRNWLPGKESVKILHVGPRVTPSEYVAAILPRAELQQECQNLKDLEKHLRQVIRLSETVPIYPMKWDTGPESDLPKVVFTDENYDKGVADARCILLREVREGRPHDPDVPGPGEAGPDIMSQRRAGTAKAKKGPTRRGKTAPAQA